MGIFIKVEIDQGKCLGPEKSGECVRICPVNIFEVKEGRVIINEENEDECILCNLCLEKCQPKAIAIKKAVRMKQNSMIGGPMEITRQLATYCEELKFKQLPDQVIDRVKYLFLDFLGVACRGSREDSSKSLHRYVKEETAGIQQGVIIGTKERATFLMAALANGTFAHAIEMDDVNNESSLHPGVVVFSSALAGAEKTRASGKRFMESAVAGYEVMIRLGKALGPENSYLRGFHPTGTCGAFGAAMAASKLFGLKKETLVHALGIAGSQAAGSMEYLAQGAWTKRFHAGWAALSGLVAAQLAGQRFKGPTTIIEGRFGFLHAYSNKADPKRVLEGMGSDFEILHTSIKPYACCRYMQPPIDAVIKVMKDHGLKAE